MFVVYGAVCAAHATGTDGAPGWTWYVAVLPACWLLGLLVERGWSAPCRRWLSAALIPGTDRLGARGDPHRCGDRDA